jgi:hypothetical protein
LGEQLPNSHNLTFCWPLCELLGLLESVYHERLAAEVCAFYLLASAIAISASALLQPGCWLQAFSACKGRKLQRIFFCNG